MTRVTLTLHETVTAAMRAQARSSVEFAGVLIVGVSETTNEVRLTARWFEPASAESYLVQTARRLDLESDAYMPALARAADMTRVYGSGMEDVGSPKVDVLDKSATRIGLGTTVHKINGKVTRSAIDALRACDIIFACTDDNVGRLDVARLAYWCLIPVFGLGALLDSQGFALKGMFSRVDVQLPGTACVQCSEVIDQDRARAEQLPEHERADLRRQGYAPELEDPDPAVITYTTLSAALAFNELVLRLTGIAADAPSRTMLFSHDRRIQLTTPGPIAGHWCAKTEDLGAGVTKRFLGRAWPKS